MDGGLNDCHCIQYLTCAESFIKTVTCRTHIGEQDTRNKYPQELSHGGIGIKHCGNSTCNVRERHNNVKRLPKNNT